MARLVSLGTGDELERLYEAFGIEERVEVDAVRVRSIDDTYGAIVRRLERDGHGAYVKRTSELARESAGGLLTRRAKERLIVRYRIFMLDLDSYTIEDVRMYDRAQF